VDGGDSGNLRAREDGDGQRRGVELQEAFSDCSTTAQDNEAPSEGMFEDGSKQSKLMPVDLFEECRGQCSSFEIERTWKKWAARLSSNSSAAERGFSEWEHPPTLSARRVPRQGISTPPPAPWRKEAIPA
jgi:hypothetical protein